MRHALVAAAIVAAVAWAGFAFWAMDIPSLFSGRFAALPGAIAAMIVPPLFLAILTVILARGRGPDAQRYIGAATALRAEAELLEIRLERMAHQLEAARRSMQDQADQLDHYGAAASSNMEAAADLIATRAAHTAQQADAAERSGAALAARLEGLIAAMPGFEDRAANIALRLEDNGHSLAARIDTLEARMQAMAELADDARGRTLSATKSLSAQLNQVQEESRATVDAINGIADVTGARIESALSDTRSALEQGWSALDERAAALKLLTDAAQDHVIATSDSAIAACDTAFSAIETDLRARLERAHAAAADSLAMTDAGLTRQTQEIDGLIDRSRASIEAIGNGAVTRLHGDFDEVEGRLHHLNQIVDGQRTLVTQFHGTLGESIEVAEQRFARLEETALARSERLAGALARLTAEAERIDGALASGGMTAEKLIGCAEGLMLALDASVRELDETYPLALDRFEARVSGSRALLESATPEMEKLEAISEALLGRTQEAEELLRNQGRRLTEWLESTQSGLEENRALVVKLRAALGDVDQDATRIAEGAGPLLVTALLRVKDTADQAAERARQALGRAIPDAARTLAEASEEALTNALGQQVEAQIARLAHVAETAVKAANQASDRLTRQLMTIADTSAGMEQRIAEAEQATEDRNREHFASRSAHLIESLNSTAIDVSKILSNDVPDSAWSAYLRGDRGVFTRRAVKLLDAGESREIALHYDEDPDFREHVNRYIHDFESMLRIILAARDGNTLGIAILSSDMGKLYVALAQAIDRLRQ